jgi:hypothetical protein
MRVPFIAAAALLVAGSFAFAAEPGPNDKTDAGSLSSKSKDSQPAAGAGSTASPTAEPKSGSLQDKGKEATDGGTNAATNPTAKPSSSDLSSKKTNN